MWRCIIVECVCHVARVSIHLCMLRQRRRHAHNAVSCCVMLCVFPFAPWHVHMHVRALNRIGKHTQVTCVDHACNVGPWEALARDTGAQLRRVSVCCPCACVCRVCVYVCVSCAPAHVSRLISRSLAHSRARARARSLSLSNVCVSELSLAHALPRSHSHLRTFSSARGRTHR